MHHKITSSVNETHQVHLFSRIIPVYASFCSVITVLSYRHILCSFYKTQRYTVLARVSHHLIFSAKPPEADYTSEYGKQRMKNWVILSQFNKYEFHKTIFIDNRSKQV